MRVEVVTVRDRREVMLERPPFCKSGETWREAVNRTRAGIRAGTLKGEPFLIATDIYRQLGGEFS
jgi:hypothetical protein